jgi:ribosomal protein S18 acetylase RimI-like enzyme
MTAIRAAAVDDYPAFTALFRELGIEEAPPNPERWANDVAPTTLVCERDRGVVGYVNFYKLAVAGHVRNLVVAPGARRAGVGRDLMTAAAGKLRAVGAVEWHLNVKRDNAAAIGLYESLGMEVEHRSTAVRMTWADAARMPSEPAVASLADPSDDNELERAFGLLAGRLAMARTRAGRVILQLRGTACEPLGLACFDPPYPNGAYPFCVARTALAGTLIAALRAHASAGEVVHLVIEDDAALVDALVAAGAGIRMQMLHYRGVL